ncbi:MAG: hypothetical protein HY721_30725 [Planctomycetes bacterium]|nr:hypothetical protein [Planctomycetota bacterium]
MIAASSYAAARDERYLGVQRVVDEMMKDPELRETIEYYSRKILKAIAAKLSSTIAEQERRRKARG